MSLPLALAAGGAVEAALAYQPAGPGGTGCPQSWRSGGRAASRRAGLLRAVLVAAQVAVSGSIAWMGLVVPHLARLLVGG